MTDLYSALGVPRDADPAMIKKAYRRKARETHPDRNPGNAAASQQFAMVSTAYRVLSDQEQRERYDRTGDAPRNVGDQHNERRSQLLQLFLQLIESCPDVAHNDLVKHAGDVLNNAQDQARRQVKQLQAKLEKRRAATERLSRVDGKPDQLLVIMRAQLTLDEQAVRRAEDTIAQQDEMRKLLAEYAYKVEKPPKASSSRGSGLMGGVIFFGEL